MRDAARESYSTPVSAVLQRVSSRDRAVVAHPVVNLERRRGVGYAGIMGIAARIRADQIHLSGSHAKKTNLLDAHVEMLVRRRKGHISKIST